ncbi:MAG: 16S rRNA (guanine(527)-N(7))-methyltransferase RsmG [Sedimentitalea sp.]|nr:16S rRNA (guanine(527)-N(7))-methyltransferase RsmG [Sedimentitalea sp.]
MIRDASNGAEGIDVSRETRRRLDAFEAILRKWNRSINLVSKGSLNEVQTRHIADSVQVFRAAPAGRRWVDLGSGGGFPGLVVAVLAAEEAPEMRVTLVESDQRKAAFLRSAARACGVTCEVLAKRAEDLPPLGADLMSARALTELSPLLEHAARHLDPTGTALFPKGATWRKEVERARETWSFQMEAIPSRTESGAVILKISEVSRV